MQPFDPVGNTATQPLPRRKRSARSRRNIGLVSREQRNPKRSTRKTAEEGGISQRSMRTIVKHDLQMKAQRRKIIFAPSKE